MFDSDVRGIYDSVINTLFDKPDRKFMVVETSFFSKWFNEQPDVVKNRVHWLVRTGKRNTYIRKYFKETIHSVSVVVSFA